MIQDCIRTPKGVKRPSCRRAQTSARMAFAMILQIPSSFTAILPKLFWTVDTFFGIILVLHSPHRSPTRVTCIKGEFFYWLPGSHGEAHA